jgi:hypothetical protein
MRTPNRTKLTQLAVDRLKPPTTEPNVTFWDVQFPGFGIRVSAKGRKTWICMYRVAGRAIMETLGTTITIPNVGDARKRASESMRRASEGINPLIARKVEEAKAKAEKEAQEFTFGKLADLFITKHVQVKQRKSTQYETERLINRVNAFWKDKPVKEIEKGHVLILLDEIASTRLRARAGAGHQPFSEAKSILVCLTTLFKWAADEDKITTNPMIGVRKNRFPQTEARDRVLDDAEIVAFWDSMNEIGWPFGPIGKLLLLTGQREGEVSGMRWTELDLDKATWNLPKERVKLQTAPHCASFRPVSSCDQFIA